MAHNSAAKIDAISVRETEDRLTFRCAEAETLGRRPGPNLVNGKLHASYRRRKRGAAQIKDEVVHVKGAADTRGHGGSYVVNRQREEQNVQDAALGDAFPLGKRVRESGSSSNPEGMINKEVLDKDGKVTPQA